MRWPNIVSILPTPGPAPRPRAPAPYFLSSSPLLLPPAAHDNDRLRIYLANKPAGCRARARARKSEGDDVEQCVGCFYMPTNTVVIPCGHVCMCLGCSETNGYLRRA